MPINKLEKLKKLSPLAAAIAFASSMSAQIQAQDFTIEGEGAQYQLDMAINTIENEGSGDHTITFASDVSGMSLYFNGFDIYEGGSVSIDGSNAPGLELWSEQKYSGNTISVSGNSSLSINDLDLHIELESEGGGNSSPLFAASGYSEITMDNVSIEAEGYNSGNPLVMYAAGGVELNLNNVDLDAGHEAEGVRVERSDVTISNSSFTGMKYSGVTVTNGGGNIKYIDISNTTFDSNGTMGALTIASYSNNSLLDVTLHDLEFSNNYSLKYTVGLEADGEGSIDATFTGSTFDNNFSKYNLVNVDADGEGSINLTLAGTKFNRNQSGSNFVDFEAEGEGSLNVVLDDLEFFSNEAEGLSRKGKGSTSILAVTTDINSYNDDNELNVTLTNSTFSSNKTSDSIILLQTRGNYYSDAYSALTVLMGNVTLSENTSSRGTLTVNAYRSYSSYTNLNLGMAHVTMVGNEGEGGGYSGMSIYNSTEGESELNVGIINSIIAGNKGAWSEELAARVDRDIESNIDVTIHNSLVGINPDAEALEGEGILVGENNIFGDPMLEKLANNGGTTLTMLPKAGSPVIDTGNANFAAALNIDLSLLFDQRAQDRLRGAAPDMGAVEAIPAGEAPTKKKKSDGFGSVGLGSLMAMFALVGLRRKRK